MTRWTSKAEEMRKTLCEMWELRGIPVFIHREGDLLKEVNTRVAKGAGTGLVVMKWLGGNNPDRRSASLRIGARYSISLWTRKVTGDDTPAEDLLEKMAERLHGWTDPRKGQLVHRLEVTSLAVVPDAPGFIVHEILAEIVRV